MIAPTSNERDAILRSDFLAFAQAAFAVLEPQETFEPSWHHEAIAVVLLGSNGKNTRKFINAPPRSLKSFLASSRMGRLGAWARTGTQVCLCQLFARPGQQSCRAMPTADAFRYVPQAVCHEAL